MAVARTRDDIVTATARVLVRSGFQSVSMQEIADEVGFTAPALYAYFESKEAILAELIQTLHREQAELFEPSPAGLTVTKRIERLLRRQLEWADRRREMFLAFFALKKRGEGLAALGGKKQPGGPIDYYERMSKWLAREARPSELGGHDSRDAACLLMGLFHGYIFRWIATQPRQPLADETDRILDLFFHGVLGSQTET